MALYLFGHMTEITQGQKKIRLIGKAVTTISILSLIASLVLPLLAIVLVCLGGFDHGVPLPDFLESAFQCTKVNTKEGLITYKEFLRADRVEIIWAVLIAFVMSVPVPLFLLKIGKCWRKGELFSMPVISSIKWIGIICLISKLITFVTQLYAGDFKAASGVGSLFETMMDNIPEVGTLSTGLVMIAISYILKYGRELESEASLTV